MIHIVWLGGGRFGRWGSFRGLDRRFDGDLSHRVGQRNPCVSVRAGGCHEERSNQKQVQEYYLSIFSQKNVHAASLEKRSFITGQFALIFTNSIIKPDAKATVNIGKTYSFFFVTSISKADDKEVSWV
jgi:hypothetical protein